MVPTGEHKTIKSASLVADLISGAASSIILSLLASARLALLRPYPTIDLAKPILRITLASDPPKRPTPIIDTRSNGTIF